ncbi:tRNA 2-thiouridine(34) synthase MnmA [Chloroflexota bacterium]
MSTRSKRVVVAMSGGVDSSVAAALLKREGYEVIGAAMRLWTEDDELLPSSHRRCCSIEEIDDARRVCQILDIPFYALNFEPQFREYVVDPFCQEYLRGRTPNPCLNCNDKIKFNLLLNKALELGADYLATGHYARIELMNGSYRLLKAIDCDKDQSYALYTLGQKELEHILFPLGNYRKSEARQIAQEMRLPVWSKEESQEICFVTSGDYRSFLAKRGLLEPGEIVNSEDKVLGNHPGLGFYTVGQRRGLGLASQVPLYALSLDTTHNRLVVGTEEELFKRELSATELRFVCGEPPREPISITAKIRYKSPEAKAVLHANGNRARIEFEEPQRAITPGQAVVFYSGDTVVGGGTIE